MSKELFLTECTLGVMVGMTLGLLIPALVKKSIALACMITFNQTQRPTRETLRPLPAFVQQVTSSSILDPLAAMVSIIALPLLSRVGLSSSTPFAWGFTAGLAILVNKHISRLTANINYIIK